ncbi:chemotaxis protein CheW [Clostridium pasteurianum]|uniref:Chemotaxis signal transduction protein n=1 Tax=Clostridium pasteurianum BC1 TaxID=86416 RepID=R4KB98_CLOPA|nr:chemotaxis protein CheW [Clostridium pasteurianum]AGK97809.1 chemotaxis signal transduction protein [Clostridium pasteurianum BC1]
MDGKELKILIFNINGEYYAADIMEVERILGYEKTTKLPDSPEFVDGLINYEGKILPVISLSRRFNLSENSINEDSKIIVSKQKESKFGIIVDVVSEVKDINIKDMEEAPDVVGGISKRYIKGLIKIDGKIIIFLRLSNILSEEEKILI